MKSKVINKPLEARKASPLLVSLSAVFLGIIAGAILIALIGKNPIAGFDRILFGALSNVRRIGNTLGMSTLAPKGDSGMLLFWYFLIYSFLGFLLEVAYARGEEYHLPQQRHDNGALLVSLSRQAAPDTSQFNDPEVWWRMTKDHHVGLVLESPSFERLSYLIDDYIPRMQRDFMAIEPPATSALT